MAPLTVTDFVRAHLHRSAWAQPHSARQSVALLDWDTVGEVLAADPAPDMIICSNGRHFPYPAPRDRMELRAYMRIGIGLAMRHTERCHPRLASIADAFRAHFSGAVQVQVFVTPGGTHGFGWHYDAEHVFIAQTAGVKNYYFRENTVERYTRFPPAGFSGIERETSPLQAATLVAGDFLYLPPRWWHMAICQEDSLSISVGVMP